MLSTEISNPAPRVGETITLSIQNTFLDDILNQQLDSLNTKQISTTSNNKDTQIELMMKDTGTYQIGPIQFTLNGVHYTTNQLTIPVMPALPKSEGFWVRSASIDNKHYIILEQVISEDNLAKATKKESKVDDDMGQFMHNSGFAGLKYKTDNRDLVFTFRSSSSNGDGNMNTYQAIYVVSFGDAATDSYTLQESDFNNLPKGTELPVIKLTKPKTE